MGSDFPRLFGRYRLQTLLAKGARSRVYLAQDTALNRSVAVKVFTGTVVPDRLPAFFRDLRAAARVKHPTIVAVHDLGEMNGQVFLSMEHLAGETLARAISRCAPATAIDRLDLIDQLCEGLAAAHDAGVVHLDLRPSKVLVSSNQRMTVLGYGLARALASAETAPHVPPGNPAYLAPEQIAGESTDHRTDVFSAAVLAYELLTGTRAYPDGPGAIGQRVLETTVASVSSRLPEVADEVDALMRQALARQPADRFQSAAELRAAFRAIRDELARRAGRTSTGTSPGTGAVTSGSPVSVSPFADTEKTRMPLVDLPGAGATTLRAGAFSSSEARQSRSITPPPPETVPEPPRTSAQFPRILSVRFCGDVSAVEIPFGRTLAGRALDVGLPLMSRVASRHHAAIVVTLSHVTVEDLGSENGTTVNDARVTGMCPVEDGDIVGFADLEYRVEIIRSEPGAGR